jgi:putative cofactor-binding repeat protein
VPFRPAGADPDDPAGIGIGGVEADTAVTGNVVECAPTADYLRDVAATGNVLGACDTGIAVSVARGAGAAVPLHDLAPSSAWSATPP